MTTSIKTFLKKILRQRGHLLRNHIGNCSAQELYAFEEAKKYVDYYNESGLKNWIKKNEDKVRLLIPHNGNKKEFDELTQLLES